MAFALDLRKYGVLALAVAVPLAAVLPLPDFWISQLSFIGMYALTCLGLVLLTLTLDLYLPRHGSMATVDLGVLIVYPICLLTPVCLLAVMAPTIIPSTPELRNSWRDRSVWSTPATIIASG